MTPMAARPNVLVPAWRVRELTISIGETVEIARTGADPTAHAADCLRKLVRADVGGLVLGDGILDHNLQRITHSGAPAWMAREIDALFLAGGGPGLDPAAAAILKSGRPAALRRELVSDRAWYHCDFVNQHRRRWDLDDSLYGVLRHPRGVAGFGCFRVWNARPLDPVDRELVALFVDQCQRVLFAHDEVRLSRRQREVLTRLLDGECAKEIAASLRISVNTTNQYIRGVYRAEQVRSRAELLARLLKGVG